MPIGVLMANQHDLNTHNNHVISRLTYPREVGNTQKAVHDKTESVVGGAIVEHGLVTTLMSENPDTDKDESLENAVKSPQGTSESE